MLGEDPLMLWTCSLLNLSSCYFLFYFYWFKLHTTLQIFHSNMATLTLALSNHLVMSLNLLQFLSETQTQHSEHLKHCSTNEWMIINDSTFLANK